ncbi:MAG: metallophosphoesterase family protein [Smithellaceae bacterium]|nr:metallophosphoesterase family protein [Syntrophaceae bacterium]MDD4240431.1 metallophosphoesterase family protein [Smithellaceae bacterium]NLX51945.1 metallophosphoesterase family protein [Deltaproteobacteria bacterium]
MKQNTVRIGVVSDTHVSGFDQTLKNNIDEHFSDVDLVFHAGDLVDLCVLDLFGDKDVRAVCGNMDNRRAQEELPEQRVMEIGGFRIGLIHGWGSPEGLERKLADKLGKVDCIVFGHTHYPMNKRVNGIYFFNPGSAMDKRLARSRSLGILEIGEDITGRIILLK